MKIDSRYYYVQDVGRENEAMEPKGTRPAAIPENTFHYE